MEEHHKHAYAVSVKKLPNSRIEISTSVPAPEFDATRTKAIARIGADVELPGFRKGHVPEKVLAAKIGEEAILEEMAEVAIGHAYPAIVVAEKLDVLGRPEVQIKKIAMGNPLEFTITTAVFPEYTTPDYKKLAAHAGKTKDVAAVSDEDVEKTIEQIRKMRAQQMAQAEEKEFDETAPLPELDDAYVQTLGEFKTIPEFKTKLRENILKEKEREIKDKKRVAIMEAIVAATKIELPEVIIEQELARMEDEFANDVARMGLDMEAYFKATGKTRDAVVAEWRPDAIKRATIQILVGRIADEEKLEPDQALIERDSAALAARYPEADKERVHSYIHMLLTNEKVFEFLEAQS